MLGVVVVVCALGVATADGEGVVALAGPCPAALLLPPPRRAGQCPIVPLECRSALHTTCCRSEGPEVVLDPMRLFAHAGEDMPMANSDQQNLGESAGGSPDTCLEAPRRAQPTPDLTPLPFPNTRDWNAAHHGVQLFWPG